MPSVWETLKKQRAAEAAAAEKARATATRQIEANRQAEARRIETVRHEKEETTLQSRNTLAATGAPAILREIASGIPGAQIGEQVNRFGSTRQTVSWIQDGERRGIQICTNGIGSQVEVSAGTDESDSHRSGWVKPGDQDALVQNAVRVLDYELSRMASTGTWVAPGPPTQEKGGRIVRGPNSDGSGCGGVS